MVTQEKLIECLIGVFSNGPFTDTVVKIEIFDDEGESICDITWENQVPKKTIWT